jgi:hypothetical protein
MRDLKEMFLDMPIIGSIILVIVLGIAFILVDGICTKPTEFSGIVLDKQYKAERNSTGTGYGMTSSGKSGVIVTTEHEDEKFLVMVKMNNGEAVTAECKANIYYSKEKDSKIDCIINKGLFTGLVWSINGIK